MVLGAVRDIRRAAAQGGGRRRGRGGKRGPLCALLRAPGAQRSCLLPMGGLQARAGQRTHPTPGPAGTWSPLQPSLPSYQEWQWLLRRSRLPPRPPRAAGPERGRAEAPRRAGR